MEAFKTADALIKTKRLEAKYKEYCAVDSISITSKGFISKKVAAKLTSTV